jgi:hypothetical protein
MQIELLPHADVENLYQLALMVCEVCILEKGQRISDKRAREDTSNIADSYFASQMTCPFSSLSWTSEQDTHRHFEL